MAPHSSTLAWKISWMEEPGRPQSMGSLRVGHDWMTSLSFSLSCIGEGNGNPLQCSCLENPRGGGAWWAAISGVAWSPKRLKWLSSSSNSVSFKDIVSLLIFLSGWSIHSWKSLTIIAFLSISPFISVDVFFMYLGASMSVAYTFQNVIYFYWIDPFLIIQCLFIFCYSFCLKVYFDWYKYCYPSFLFFSFPFL